MLRCSSRSQGIAEKQSSKYRLESGGFKGRTTSDSSLAMRIFVRTRDIKGFPIKHPLICLQRWPLKLNTMFLVTLKREGRLVGSQFYLAQRQC